MVWKHCKVAAYNVRRAVNEAKGDQERRKKVELQFQDGNPRSMSQSLRPMTDMPTPPSMSSADASSK